MSCVVALLASGCGTFRENPARTFVPAPIVEVQPSFDKEEQNSGLIDYVDGKGFLITSDAAARYRELTKLFGAECNPPLKEGEGLEEQAGGNYILPSSYMVEFGVMNDKFKKRK